MTMMIPSVTSEFESIFPAKLYSVLFFLCPLFFCGLFFGCRIVFSPTLCFLSMGASGWIVYSRGRFTSVLREAVYLLSREINARFFQCLYF